MVSTFFWWEFSIGFILNPISEDRGLTLELAALITRLDLCSKLERMLVLHTPSHVIIGGCTQSVIDPLLSCPGALSMAAGLFDAEKDCMYCVERNRWRKRGVLRSW